MANFGRPQKGPDDTEGYASITLTLKEPNSSIKTIACFIKNDLILQELQRENQSDLYVRTHKETKLFLYFFCSESDLSNRLVKSEIVAHRYTKPTKDKNCIIENKLQTQPFFLKPKCNHVFLPACHEVFKTVEFEDFLTKNSKAVTIKNISAGKYRGVQNSDIPVKYLSFSLSSSNDTLNIPNPSYDVFQNLVDGPLLFEEASESWKLIGWYKNTAEKDRIIIHNLITQDTTDIWRTSISNQTDGSQHPPNPSVSADPHTNTDQANQSVSADPPTSTSQPIPSGSADPATSTDQSDQPGSDTGVSNNVQDPVSHNQPTQNSMPYQPLSGSNVGLSSDGANGQQDGVSTMQPRVEPANEAQGIANLLSQMELQDRYSPSLQQEVSPPQANGIQSSAEPQQRNEEQEAVIDERPQNELQNRVINEEERLEDGAESETEQLEQQEHAQEEAAAISEDPLVSALMENSKELMDKICLMLYPYKPIIDNWESFAFELGAPPSVRTQVKRLTQHSQTRELFNSMSSLSGNLTVQELITVLEDLRRQDVVHLLHKKIPENERQGKVTEKVMSDEALMEELETLLDKESKVAKNWYHTGLKLGLSKETLQEIKDGNYHEGVGGLFAYIFTVHPKLTVERFKEIMVKIDRKDVLDQLSDVSEGLMKTKIPLDSDKMRSIYYLLSKNSCGTVKDWKHLARELDIEYHKYQNFEKETPESPTKLLLEWALIEKPKTTVSDLCEIFKNMKRYDVIEAIEEFYGRSFIQS